MNLCADGHAEVCYEVRDCPACKLKEELADLEKQYAALEKEYDEQKNQLP